MLNFEKKNYWPSYYCNFHLNCGSSVSYFWILSHGFPPLEAKVRAPNGLVQMITNEGISNSKSIT